MQGTLETKEYLISEIMKELELTNERLCVLTALLGNYLLPDKELKDVYKAANIDALTEVCILFVTSRCTFVVIN